MSKMITGNRYIVKMPLCMAPLGGKLEISIPRGSYFLFLEETTYGHLADLRVMFDGVEGVIRWTQASYYNVFLEMGDVSHLKVGRLYRHACYRQPMHKEALCQNIIGWAKEGAVVMLIEQHPKIANLYKVISGEIAGWLHAFPEHLKELTKEEELTINQTDL